LRRAALLVVTVLSLSLVAAGCGGGDEEEALAPPETQPAATEPPAATVAAGGGPIVFVLSGGIEGRNDMLVVEPDGTATATDGFEGREATEQLADEELAELYGLLDESGLFTEDRGYEGDIVDDFAFEIVYRGFTVAGDESASPPELDPARGRLTELLESILASGAEATQELQPLELTLQLTGDIDGIATQLPEQLTGHLYLQTDGDGGIRGALSIARDGVPLVTEVSGRLDGRTATLDPGGASVNREATLQWDSWEMTLDDSDGDGVIDAAAGRLAGTWTDVTGDVIDQGAYEATLTAAPDRSPGQVYIAAPSPREFLQPGDEIEISFDEPVRSSDVSTMVTVLADGEPPTGFIAVAEGVDGLVATASFVPSAGFLPFGAEVTVDAGGLVDPAGNPVTSEAGPLQTAPDPGSLLDNPGFESGLEGWIASGAVEAVGDFEGLTPDEGDAFAVVREQSSLAGYLDVPADAEAVEFTVAILSEANQFDAGHSVVMSLKHADGGYAVFDGSAYAGESVSCDTCTELGYRIDPMRQRVDLSNWQGKRVFLTVDVRSSFFFGVNFFAVVLDDFRLV
jgi:hypothetical protein